MINTITTRKAVKANSGTLGSRAWAVDSSARSTGCPVALDEDSNLSTPAGAIFRTPDHAYRRRPEWSWLRTSYR